MNRRIIVCALIKKDSRYLFIKQNKPGGAYPGTLHIPGGGLEDGEDLDTAIRREIREETGIEVKNLQRYDFDADILDYKGQPTQLIFLQYTCEWESGQEKPGTDAAEILWIAPEEMHATDHSPPSQKLLKKMGLLA